LAQLCNKLGDPVPRVAAQCTHFLNQLINRHHPFMKPVVVDEVERVLYRPNIGSRAQYYGLCFLSEVMFAPGGADQELANKLIGLYFGFFKACCKRGDINNKMMSVLLTGVSRAFPYSKLDSRLMEDHLQTFYKLIHFVNENTGIQALCLIFNILDVQQTGSLTDRFYAVLYRHLLDVQLEYCSRRAMLLNLVYRAMKRDPVLRRVKAFVKRLLQVCMPFPS
jgi:ribosome biogenesis protein MAK21